MWLVTMCNGLPVYSDLRVGEGIIKNGRSRWVPLSELALKHIEQAPRTADRVFPITDIEFQQAWTDFVLGSASQI